LRGLCDRWRQAAEHHMQVGTVFLDLHQAGRNRLDRLVEIAAAGFLAQRLGQPVNDFRLRPDRVVKGCYGCCQYRGRFRIWSCPAKMRSSFR
jgi:hypothetical protein